MTLEGEGTGKGTEGEGTGAGTGQNEGLWRAQLPADLKDNELLTPYKTIGDAAKAHIDTVGKMKDLEGKLKEHETKLATAIVKPGEKATKEEIAAYRKSMDIPDTPDGYEIPKVEGEEGNKEMEAWARETFHKADLSKAQAKLIGEQWNGFITEFNKAYVEAEKKAVDEAMTKLKTDLGAAFNEQYELGKRLFKKVMDADFSETDHINLPTVLKFIIKSAKLVGEDKIPPGGQLKGEAVKEGMIYNKTPGMH